MNKLLHGVILVIFAFACWLMWGMLGLVSRGPVSIDAPQFTLLCADLRWVFILLPVLATSYCCFVWFRKEAKPGTWLGFFAATMLALVLTMFPTMVALWLPMVKFMELAALK